MMHLQKSEFYIPYLPVYKSTRCISRPPKIRRKFTIYDEYKVEFYDSVYKSRSIFFRSIFDRKRSTYTPANTVVGDINC